MLFLVFAFLLPAVPELLAAQTKKPPAKGKTTANGVSKSEKPDASSEKTRPDTNKNSEELPAVGETAATGDSRSPEPTPIPVDPDVERKRFEAALSAPANTEKARLLREFIQEFPSSEIIDEAREYLLSARYSAGTDEIKAGRLAEAAAIFETAIDEAPPTVSNRLYSDTILKFPSALFYTDRRASALEIARKIEIKFAGSSRHLLGLVFFYLSTENGSDAKRLAEAAITLEPDSAAGYQALGLAARLNFDLDEAARAFSKASELDAGSVAIRRSLAETKRALGRSEDAIAIYRSMLAANESDLAARSGLVLSLFDVGRRTEAEAELARVLEKDPRNFTLLAGVAYQYAALNLGEKAVEFARRAVGIEPRYVWGHIALGRGLMKLNDPAGAERALVSARRFGNFPSLDYEIASARFMAGFYREAIEELDKSFVITDGLVQTKLGGRVEKGEKGFQELVAHERKASILVSRTADDPDAALKLKQLFEITKRLDVARDDEAIVPLVDRFIAGDDKMKVHRQLHTAELLLSRRAAVPKTAEILRSSFTSVESGLEVAAAGAAVMASELYESRKAAFRKNEFVLIPEVPRQTLSAILRGRIEDLAGWASLELGDPEEAMVRFKRAISVLPDKSAWWRSSRWRLASALESSGRDQEALDIYIQTYKIDRPDAIRYGTIEALYRKVNGNADGLEEQIGPNPLVAMTPRAATPVDQPSARTEAANNVEDPNKLSPKADAVAAVNSKEIAPERKDEPALDVAKTRPEPAPVEDTKPVAADITTSGETAKVADLSKPILTTSSQTATKASKPEKKADVEIPIVSDVASADQQKKLGEKAGLTESERAEPQKNEDKTASDPKVLPETKEAISEAKEKVETPEKPVVRTDTAADEKLDKKPAADTARKLDVPIAVETAKTEAKMIEAHPPPETTKDAEKVTDQKATAGLPEKSREASKPESPTNLLREPFPITGTPEANLASRTETKPDSETEKVDARPKVRDLYDPIIVTIPPPPRPAAKRPELAKDEEAVPGAKTPKDQKPKTDDPTGGTRKRVVEGEEISVDQVCEMDISQKNISIMSNGGSLGVLLTVSGDATVAPVKASSSSPRDLEVRAEPEIAGLPGQRYFLIKSISPATGMFQVSFESPCGKREVTVRVR